MYNTNKKESRMKSLFMSMIVMLNISLYADTVPTRTDDFPKEQMKSQNKIITKMFVEEMSKSLPQTIDKYTKFVKIDTKDTNIVYTFEINTGSKSDKTVRKEDRSRMHRAVQNGICKSSMKFLDAGISISYLYVSASSKAELFKFDVSQKDCIKIIH